MIQLKVNGVSRSFNGDPDMPLLWYLRDVLRTDRNEIRLRDGALRRVHRASEWRSDPLLLDADAAALRARKSRPSKA